MRKFLILLTSIISLAAIQANEPDTLTLEDCLRKASGSVHLKREKQLSEQILNEKLQDLRNNWYPSIELNAHALYNSETVEFSDLIEGLPVQISSLPLDQYKIWADINQKVFDGGILKVLKENEKAGYLAGIYQTESDMLELQFQVSQLFFSLLQTQNNFEVIASSLDLLINRKNTVKAGVSAGVVLPENLLALEAEEISLRQKLTELRYLKNQLFKVISILTDTMISEKCIVALPDIPEWDQNGIRPEFKLFKQQKEIFKINQKLINAGELPKIFAFSQLAWGRPGYNMVSRDFHTFYTIGAGLKWNFLNYGDSKRQIKILEFRKDLVDIKQDYFSDQLQVLIEAESSNILKYDSLMKQDEEILNLRKSIAESSLSRLTNGVITSADYLETMNAELLSRLQLENHRIQWKQAEYKYLMLQGKMTY
jgi:outer membrane protein TolC